ncbi:MAG: coproporphyrinogen III oxidase family protein, partial [Chloroflexi bacterium]
LETASLYLHIPFCHTRCHYCDFNTYAGILPLREPYVRALLTEIATTGTLARLPSGKPRRSRTIFFGGGTPSLLSVEQITRILNACSTSFSVDEGAEITLEANPGTLSQEQLAGLRSAGINRLSMGAQSFDAQLLKTLGRIHSPEEITQAMQYARAAGFTSINLDFMFGLPGQTMRHWRETLDRALDLHYENYEISNWSLPGHQSRHNLTYWHNLPYLGMGAGAYSFFGSRRFSNVREPLAYIRLLRAGQRPEAESESESVDRAQAMSETAFLALRTAMGLHLPTFEERFSQPFTQFASNRLQLVEEAGLLEHDHDWLRLSKRGRLLGNEVFLRLLPD